METRPTLDKNISIKDFTDFYWLKKELQTFCRTENLSSVGSKMEIASRIADYLRTGKVLQIPTTAFKANSKFDWRNENLTLEMVITDSYKNSENVRLFFRKEIGRQFRFNVKFMAWMKANVGKNLKDGIDEWLHISKQQKIKNSLKEIKPQFEYNTYMRDFLLNNPDKTRDFGIKLWKLKKSKRGANKYDQSDFELL